MSNNNRTAFYELITKTATFYDKKLQPAVIEIYWEDLQNYNLEDIRKALNLHRNDDKRGRYMPKTADIVCHLRNAAKQNSSQQFDFKYFQCSILSCKNPGTMSHSTHEGNWICKEHYRDESYKKERDSPFRTAEIVNLDAVARRSTEKGMKG